MLQALAGECCALMWALVDVNPAVLASFINCDIEAAAPRQDISPDMWPSILVSSHMFVVVLPAMISALYLLYICSLQ
jgi:hypothetical protein